MVLLLILQVGTAVFFCAQKQGFHYDEYYSYYSSNVTYGLHPTDGEWKDTKEIRSEFMALKGEGFAYDTVKLMQSWDVHPPLYYYVLRTVCVLSPGVFSKCQGLSVNLLFFVLSWIVLAKLTAELTGKDKKKILAVCTLFGFSPAIMSGITFIRMYMMLTFACLLILYVHVRAIMRQKASLPGFYLPVILLSFVGFQIHYYFAVFLFFLAAAVSLYLFFHKDTRKRSFLYAASVICGMLLSVAVYPACFSHIFKGYRGTEAQDAFFDLGNIGQRLDFFFDLTDEYVFGGMLPILLLIMILLGLTHRMKAKTESSRAKIPWSPKKRAVLLTVVTGMGYFFVVAKTALLNAEEAIRYEMPVYGLLILLVVLCLTAQTEAFAAGSKSFALSMEQNQKWLRGILLCLMVLTLGGQVYGLWQGKVCFLYPEDKANTAWADEHAKEDIVYIYNPDNQWMIWDDAGELMQYDKIYFISSTQEKVSEDERLSASDHVYVYKMRGEQAETVLEELAEENGGFREINLIRELLYCDLYELKR